MQQSHVPVGAVSDRVCILLWFHAMLLSCAVCRSAEYVQRYANPQRMHSRNKPSEDGSDKMDEDGQQQAGEEEDSDEGFLSSSEEEEQ